MGWPNLFEDENADAMLAFADLSLDREMLQDVIRRKLEGVLAGSSWSMQFVQAVTAGLAEVVFACQSGRTAGMV